MCDLIPVIKDLKYFELLRCGMVPIKVLIQSREIDNQF